MAGDEQAAEKRAKGITKVLQSIWVLTLIWLIGAVGYSVFTALFFGAGPLK